MKCIQQNYEKTLVPRSGQSGQETLDEIEDGMVHGNKARWLKWTSIILYYCRLHMKLKGKFNKIA